ncbi:MAG: hypothetical protein L6R48_04550 [Planctomycetes bacterium]|nr:hypothetical protein [Planctomycetota bacterium]
MDSSPPPISDRSSAPPRLRIDWNLGSQGGIGPGCSMPRVEDGLPHLRMLAQAGFAGVQGGDPALCRSLGLGVTGGFRVNRPEEAEPQARACAAAGLDAATLHLGWGHESEAEADALIRAVLDASQRHGIHLAIETHRATITQDSWRTVEFTRRFPGIRFNADYSHWYCGLEMPYGDFEAKLRYLQPVFARVSHGHARIASSSQIQIPLDQPAAERAIVHFQRMWTLTMTAWKEQARPGHILPVAVELLGPDNNYALRRQQPDGTWVEAGDRWRDALRHAEILRGCWAAAA